MQEQCWELTSSDEEPAASHSQAGKAVPRRSRVRIAGAVRPVPPVPQRPPVARAVVAPRVPRAEDGRPPVFGGPRVCRVAAWPKMLRHQHGSKWSYLRVSQTWGKAHWDMRACCGNCGATLDNNCNNGRRPIGLLWSWLIWGQQHCEELIDCGLHYRQRPEFALRASARAEFEALPENEQWVDVETGGRGGGEPVVCP